MDPPLTSGFSHKKYPQGVDRLNEKLSCLHTKFTSNDLIEAIFEHFSSTRLQNNGLLGQLVSFVEEDMGNSLVMLDGMSLHVDAIRLD